MNKQVPVVIVRNLPNGSPSISATTSVASNDNNTDTDTDFITDCHNVLLANHEYEHRKLNDIFAECLQMAKSQSMLQANTSTMKRGLKHCSISFEKNLNLLETFMEGSESSDEMCSE